MFDPLLFTTKLRRVVWFPVYSSLHRQHTTRTKRYKAQKILYRVRKRRLLLALYLFCRSCKLVRKDRVLKSDFLRKIGYLERQIPPDKKHSSEFVPINGKH